MSSTTSSEDRRRVYLRRRIAVGSLAAIVLLGGGYTAAVAVTPLPELRAQLTVEAETRTSTDTAPLEAAVAMFDRPTAIGWGHSDEIWVNDDARYRIASLTKLVTVLVGLEAAPVEAGTDGPLYTVSENDALLVDEVREQDGTFAPMPVGLQLTTRQLLELVLVPSANNYAIAYARWVFGSDEAFLAATNDWLTRNGLESLHIVDASGLSDDNLGGASDIVRLSRLALEDPLVADIVQRSVIDVPGLGEITTTNRLLGEPGVIGLKTGTVYPESYNLAAAQRDLGSGRDLVAIAVTLDRPDAESRADDTRAVLAAAVSTIQTVSLVERGDPLGTVTTWQGDEIELVADAGAGVALVPGETASRTVELGTVLAGPRGSVVGTVHITAPFVQGSSDAPEASDAPLATETEQSAQVQIVTASAIEAPDFWWRLTHPDVIFGGSAR